MFRLLFASVLLCVAIAPSFQASVKIDDRVIGGKTVMIKSAPYIVSMQMNEVHKCGGSILNEWIILTAAHCIKAFEDKNVREPSIRAGSTIWSAGGQLVPVKKMIKHDLYNPTTNHYDIGMLLLEFPLELDDTTVKAINLTEKVPGDGRDCLVAGWGLKKEKAYMVSTMLQQAAVKSISRDRCASDFGYNGDITDTMVCANNPGVDTCQGDSGGPYICKNLETKEFDQLVGVTSFGRGCGRPNFPGVYTLVLSVKKWILKNIAAYTPESNPIKL